MATGAVSSTCWYQSRDCRAVSGSARSAAIAARSSGFQRARISSLDSPALRRTTLCRNSSSRARCASEVADSQTRSRHSRPVKESRMGLSSAPEASG